jgi:hypothetical protein
MRQDETKRFLVCRNTQTSKYEFFNRIILVELSLGNLPTTGIVTDCSEMMQY